MAGVRSEMYLKFSTCNLLCSHGSLTPFLSWENRSEPQLFEIRLSLHLLLA
ncbi:hypothetical protein Hdeb2414_s0007g00257121 [Helianthus debilis subsp. tardiflorus]